MNNLKIEFMRSETTQQFVNLFSSSKHFLSTKPNAAFLIMCHIYQQRNPGKSSYLYVPNYLQTNNNNNNDKNNNKVMG